MFNRKFHQKEFFKNRQNNLCLINLLGFYQRSHLVFKKNAILFMNELLQKGATLHKLEGKNTIVSSGCILHPIIDSSIKTPLIQNSHTSGGRVRC